MKTARLYVDVNYDPKVTDAEGVSEALDTLLETAMSTPEILDEYGNPEVGAFCILRTPLTVKMSEIKRTVWYDPEPDDSYADQEGFEEERAAIDRGDLVAYGCRAAIWITIPATTASHPDYNTDRGHGSDGITHHIDSPGLWGIFAKSNDEPYFDEVFKEEREMLVHMLTTMGIEVEDDSLLCRYNDCVEEHRVAAEHERVTCPTCRKYLGLGQLEKEGTP